MELSLCHLSRYPNLEKKGNTQIPHPYSPTPLVSTSWCQEKHFVHHPVYVCKNPGGIQEPWKDPIKQSPRKCRCSVSFWNSIKARWNSSLQWFTWTCIWHENFITLRNFITLIQTYWCMNWSKTKSRMHLKNKPHIFITRVQWNFK